MDCSLDLGIKIGRFCLLCYPNVPKKKVIATKFKVSSTRIMKIPADAGRFRTCPKFTYMLNKYPVLEKKKEKKICYVFSQCEGFIASSDDVRPDTVIQIFV